MGCFSYLCKKCGKPINSVTFNGDACHLFLLKNGKLIEHMHGNYDSYGRVFNSKQFNGSFEWKLGWTNVHQLNKHPEKNNGIAAYHDECYSGTKPRTRSEGDPNQGFGVSPMRFSKEVLIPKHEVY
jgi:hypothetical protein